MNIKNIITLFIAFVNRSAECFRKIFIFCMLTIPNIDTNFGQGS